MAAEKSRAIVMKLVPFSESSYVATVYTEDYGKITGLAKGARRAKSAFASALDLLSVCRIVFLRKSTDALDLFTEAALERPFRSAIRDLSRLYAGYYALELTDALTENRDPNPELFRNLLRTIIDLDTLGSVSQSLLRFELAALKLTGHMPSLDECVECGMSVPVERRIAFGQLSGGVLCERCKIGKRQVIAVSPQGIRMLRAFSTETQEMDYRAEVTSEVRMVVNRYISHLLGRRPRMYEYLGFG